MRTILWVFCLALFATATAAFGQQQPPPIHPGFSEPNLFSATATDDAKPEFVAEAKTSESDQPSPDALVGSEIRTIQSGPPNVSSMQVEVRAGSAYTQSGTRLQEPSANGTLRDGQPLTPRLSGSILSDSNDARTRVPSGNPMAFEPNGIRPNAAARDAQIQAPGAQASGSRAEVANALIQAVVEANLQAEPTAGRLQLVDLLNQAPIQERAVLIRDYWTCFERMGLRYVYDLELSQLNRVAQLTQRGNARAINSAQTQAAARRLEVDLNFKSMSPMLRRYTSLPATASPLVPASIPLTDVYLTHYESLAGRLAPDSALHQIDDRLSQLLQSIWALADNCVRDREAVDQASMAWSQQQITASELLWAVQNCRLSHEAFLRMVTRYNQEISRYALAVAPYGQAPEVVVAMLIKTNQVSVLEPSNSRIASTDSGSNGLNAVNATGFVDSRPASFESPVNSIRVENPVIPPTGSPPFSSPAPSFSQSAAGEMRGQTGDAQYPYSAPPIIKR